MTTIFKATKFRKLPLCMAMLGCLYGGAALAQVAPAPTTQEERDEAKKKEDVKNL